MYTIFFPNSSISKRCDNFIKKLSSKNRERVKSVILSLKTNPKPQGKIWKSLKPPIHIQQEVANYRIRIGDYRVLYDIDESKKRIILLGIRKRNESTFK